MMCACQHCHGACGREATTEVELDGVVTPVCELCRHESAKGCGWQETHPAPPDGTGPIGRLAACPGMDGADCPRSMAGYRCDLRCVSEEE